MRVLVTGGCGFIGSNFVRYVLRDRAEWSVTNLDKLTYAGNLANLADIADGPRYRFVRADVSDAKAVAEAMQGCDAVVSFAGETHVDRSLMDAGSFIMTNVYGVRVLLEAARDRGIARYLHISTDEVYGSIEQGAFREDDRLTPSSPYSASKAGGDLLAQSYYTSHGTPVIVARPSNTYGPYQYPEKLLPLFITNAIDDQPLPMYGDGMQVRDWLFVEDHCRALVLLLEQGEPGTVYNIGAGNDRPNIEVIKLMLAQLGKPEGLIRHVADRPGHDRRYAVDTARIRALGFEPRYSIETGFAATMDWYAAHRAWWEPIKSGEFRRYYERQYGERLRDADGGHAPGRQPSHEA